MLNDRDDKYDSNNDDSEYHFSDEEVSYEVEPETTKAATPEAQGNFLSRLTRSKRMLISLGVFLVLVFIVYKMVAPTTTTTAPSTEIAATPLTQAAPVAQQQPPAAQLTQAVPAPQQPQPQIIAPQAPVSTSQAMGTEPSVVLPAQQQVAPSTSPSAPMTGMPSVIPVQSVQPSYNMSGAQGTPPVVTQAPAPNIATLPSNDPNIASMTSTSDRLIGQLQAEYAQRLNDYAAQNKALQDQIQSLNTRVVSMETQMNQLIQVLTRQSQSVANAPPPQTAEPQAAETKLNYSVQAIIPGRAWLRSDNGDTVTVAEGDVIRDLGRVTKIDPYDGIVEINTGSKIISLSYGNGS